ncbi:hypothetical protein QYF36_007462 [Acer negundo]|nr:hypothetical protein QYF36_007462 [Acer negundo]
MRYRKGRRRAYIISHQLIVVVILNSTNAVTVVYSNSLRFYSGAKLTLTPSTFRILGSIGGSLILQLALAHYHQPGNPAYLPMPR